MSAHAEAPEEILTTAGMAAADRAAVSRGISIDHLMLAAGHAVAAVICEDVSPPQKISILCGPGNNGGDGFVVASALASRGYAVDVFAAAAPQPAAAKRAAALWAGPVHPFSAFEAKVGERRAGGGNAGGLVVDALFGAGLSRPISGDAAGIILRLPHLGARVISVDVPSGLNGDTGHPMGPCVRAHRTVTFFRGKPAHFLWPGRGLCGQITLADIGLSSRDLVHADGTLLVVNAPALWRTQLPAATPDAHKYARGHCLVVSGPELQTGASRLAAIAALNNGAGAVTIAGDRPALRIHAAHLTAIMLREAAGVEAFGALLESKRFSSVVIGPGAGVGETTLARILAARRAELPLVIDADGLTSLVGAIGDMRGVGPAELPCVLTPHSGEFERLFAGILNQDAHFHELSGVLRLSKVEQARAAARISGAVVVFKGLDTVIAAPDGRAAINANAGPELATAGAGDVLAGLIGAHLARGMPAFEASAAAVWQHGALGAEFGSGLTADRLAERVRPLDRLI